MTTTTAPALRLTISAATTRTAAGTFVADYARPLSAEVRGAVADLETAQAIVALFPKSVGIKASGLTGSTEGTGFISFRVQLLADDVNKGRNETGIKRLTRLLAVAEKHGLAIEFDAPYSNSYLTLADAQAAIA